MTAGHSGATGAASTMRRATRNLPWAWHHQTIRSAVSLVHRKSTPALQSTDRARGFHSQEPIPTTHGVPWQPTRQAFLKMAGHLWFQADVVGQKKAILKAQITVPIHCSEALRSVSASTIHSDWSGFTRKTAAERIRQIQTN